MKKKSISISSVFSTLTETRKYVQTSLYQKGDAALLGLTAEGKPPLKPHVPFADGIIPKNKNMVNFTNDIQDLSEN